MRRNKISTVPTLLMALSMVAIACAAASPEGLERAARDALRLAPNVARGKLLYARNCASCHSADAHGDVIRLIPALAGQRRGYLIKHVAELNAAERAAAHMHPQLTAAELRVPQGWADLAAFLQQCAPLPATTAGNPQLLERGGRNYRRWCAVCHGSDASGDDAEFVPALRHQRREYLLKELRTISSTHRLSVRSEVLRVLDSLNSESTAGIADYVAGIEAPAQ